MKKPVLLKKILNKILGESPAHLNQTAEASRKSWSIIEQYRALQAKRLLGETQPSGEAPRVLMATTMLGYNHAAVVDTVVGLGLVQRGARVEFLGCDRMLPACQLMGYRKEPREGYGSPLVKKRCESCYTLGCSVNEELGFRLHKFSDYLPAERMEELLRLSNEVPLSELASYTQDGVKLGEHALAGALRFFAKGELTSESHGEFVLRRYFESALRVKEIFSRILRENRYQSVVIHHGIYVPQGILVEVCHQYGVRVVTWNPAYRKHSFVFSQEDSYHHTMVSEPSENWEGLTLSAEQDKQLTDYLMSRRYGTGDWIWFHKEPEHDLDIIARELNLDRSKPIVTLLSNVVWDAQLHYASNAFSGMTDWVLETIRYFEKRPGLQLVVRIHPAELTGFVASRQLLQDEIAKVFLKIPGNVRVVAPDTQVSTYGLGDLSNAVLIYNTKTGIELSAFGIPVIVAGEAWIRGKGFSRDARNPEHYFSLLDELPFKTRLGERELKAARLYAYHVFFRRMIPLPFIEGISRAEFGVKLDSLDELKAGRSRGLDVVCEGILDAKPFIYPAEEMANREGT